MERFQWNKHLSTLRIYVYQLIIDQKCISLKLVSIDSKFQNVDYEIIIANSMKHLGGSIYALCLQYLDLKCRKSCLSFRILVFSFATSGRRAKRALRE